MKKLTLIIAFLLSPFIYGQSFDGNLASNSLKWTMEQKDFDAAPRANISPMSLKLWDNYNGINAPSTYGTLMEVNGRSGHLVSQLYFTGLAIGGGLKYRSGWYNQTTWSDWRNLLDSKSDVESSGILKLTGTGNSYILNGNVGFGTTVPTASLEINAPSIVGSETLLKLRISDASQDFFSIANGTNTNEQFIPALMGYRVSDNRPSLFLTASTEVSRDNGVDPLMVFDSRTSSAAVVTRPLFSWDSYGNRKMILASNGNLGIGITNPQNKLDVNGTIHSKEVKVDMIGWSDFVFKKEYDLPTLEEVEKHINEKGHLENIPSEEEVLKNGINLGEMNSKLLQKIEELTIYMIDFKKEMNELKRKNKIQEEEIKKLKEVNKI